MPSQREGGGGGSGGSTGMEVEVEVWHTLHMAVTGGSCAVPRFVCCQKKRKKEKKLPALHFALLFNFAAQRLANFFLGKATVCMASSQVVSVQQLIKSQTEEERRIVSTVSNTQRSN